MGDKLVGMKEICNYLGVSESTALKWRREYDLPIKKKGHIWISTKAAIDVWFRRDEK